MTRYSRRRETTAANSMTRPRPSATRSRRPALHYTDRPPRPGFIALAMHAPETRGIRVTGAARRHGRCRRCRCTRPCAAQTSTYRGCKFAQRRRYDTLRPAPDDVNHRTVSTASEQVSPTAVWQREIGRRTTRGGQCRKREVVYTATV